jgi:hypothetical protein
VVGSKIDKKELASRKPQDPMEADLLTDSRGKYRDAMIALTQVERGLLGLRALMQLSLIIISSERSKALYGVVKGLNDGLKKLNTYTFKGFLYADNRLCRITNMKEHRLRVQLQLLFDAVAEASAVVHADEIIETTVRHSVRHVEPGTFPEVESKLIRDKHFRHKVKHFPKIVDLLGAEFLKVSDLDQRAFILK